LAGSAQAVVVGGMESMSNAPYLLPKARSGQRLGHGQMIDHMFFDGLEDHYSAATRGRLMGTFAEDCARHYGFTREAQDAYAVTSTTRAQGAIRDGHFGWETTPSDRGGAPGRHRGPARRTTAQGPDREDLPAQAGFRQGRHRHPPPIPAPSPTVRPPWC
jgi:acetyl-CoA C-acetyltransferase